MANPQPLHARPFLRTRDPDELRQALAPVYSVKHVDMPAGGRGFEVSLNHCQFGSIGLTYGRYLEPVRMDLELADCFVQGFPTAGGGHARWNRREMTLAPDQHGIAGGPGMAGTLQYAGGFEHFAMRIAPAALTRVVACWIGRPVVPALRLQSPVSTDPAELRRLRRLVEFLAREIDEAEAPLPPLMVAELEQAVLVSFLHAHEHNYSRWLRGAQRPAAPWRARRVADFIEAHWDEAVSIEDLSRISGTSARSLFDGFRKAYGVPPMAYARAVRLQRARERLMHPGPGVNVTAVAVRCGFPNPGRFTRDYLAAFGELPSETLRSAHVPS